MAGSSPTAILQLSLSAPFSVLALFRRLLLLPLLSPLLTALLLAALNPRPALSLRLLIWQTPALPIGLWIAAGASGGALLGASAATLALHQGGASQRRRQGRQELAGAGAAPGAEAWPAAQPVAARGASWFHPPREAVSPREAGTVASGEGRQSAAAAAPQRAPGEGAPTVAVPFRVLHRPSAPAAAAEAWTPERSQPEPQVQRGVPAQPVADDDWTQSEGDDW